MDIGVQFGVGTLFREWQQTATNRDYRFYTTSVVSHYNFRQTKNVSPFIGCGVGVSAVRIDHSDLDAMHPEHDLSACITPRIGIEFFHHLRFALAYRLMNREYTNLEVSLGVVLGGGRR